MVFCTNCGIKAQDGARFCTSCGTKLTTPAPHSSFSASATSRGGNADSAARPVLRSSPSPAATSSGGRPKSPPVLQPLPPARGRQHEAGGTKPKKVKSPVRKTPLSPRKLKNKVVTVAKAKPKTPTTGGRPEPGAARSWQQRQEEEARRREEDALARKREEEKRRRKREAEARARAEEGRKQRAEEERRRKGEEERRRKDEQQRQDRAQRQREADDALKKREREKRTADQARAREREERKRREKQAAAHKDREDRERREREERTRREREERERKEKENAARRNREEQERRKKKAQAEADLEHVQAKEIRRRDAEKERLKAQAAEEQRKRIDEAKKKRAAKEAAKKQAAPPAASQTPSPVHRELAPPRREVSAPAMGGGKMSKWEQMMQAKAQVEYDKSREVIRARRGKAAKHVDEQIRKLVLLLKQYSTKSGHPNPPGVKGLCLSVRFGDLFAGTQGSMSEIAATLSQAKKKGVITYEGVMLQQGYHDDVLITLVSESFKGTEVFKSTYVPAKKPSGASMAPKKCHVCGKTAFITERIEANGLTFHRSCFRCKVCNSALRLASYSFVNDTYYCKPCFARGHSDGSIKFT